MIYYPLKKQAVSSDKKTISLVKTNIKDAAHSLIISNRLYQITDKLPDDNSRVIGYVECDKSDRKQNKDSKPQENIVGYINSNIPVLSDKPRNDKLLGYVKTDDDSYIGILQKKYSKLPILAAIGCIILMLFLVLPKSTVPIDNNTDKTASEFTNNQGKPPEPAYFNVNLNLTPTIENGKMNLRVQNTGKARGKPNDLSCVVEIQLISKKDYTGRLIETYKEPLNIYRSPVLKPSEKIEFCTITKNIAPGRYEGRALYTIYDNQHKIIGTTAAKLDIVAK
jgi:hypothetical protein